MRAVSSAPDPAAGGKRNGRWWTVSAREARVHATILAVALWTAALVFAVAGPTRRSVAGPLKGGDFIQYYTLGHLAAAGDAATMYDAAGYHAAQVALVPESVEDIYPTVYPPQTALLFVPFSLLSYGQAALLWAVLSLLVYAAVVRSAWRAGAPHLRDRGLLIASAAAFPPVWQMVLHGQVTIVLLAASCVAWRALCRRRHALAGAALGALALKPQFGLAFAVIVLARRDWPMLWGAAASVALQALAVWVLLGPAALSGFASVVPVWLADPDFLEAKAYQSHSIRAVTRLLPSWGGAVLWAAASSVVLWQTGRVWLSGASLEVRFGLVLLASVLVNPHLIVYDAALLALPLLWWGSWFESRPSREDVRAYWAATYALFAAFLIPTAALLAVQASVLLMGWMFWFVSQRALSTGLSRAASVQGFDGPRVEQRGP